MSTKQLIKYNCIDCCVSVHNLDKVNHPRCKSCHLKYQKTLSFKKAQRRNYIISMINCFGHYPFELIKNNKITPEEVESVLREL